MKIVITDSGLGGLSVAAQLYENLIEAKFQGNAELIYVNALPEQGQGYNTMSENVQKIRVFNNVLHGINRRFNPDLVAIACNTLSVIVDQTNYYRDHKNQIIDIVKMGLNTFIKNIQKARADSVIILGTETTIEKGVHRSFLIEHGFVEGKIIGQICSGLASEIEKDYQSIQTRELAEKCLKSALKWLNNKDLQTLYIYLACTHYGYILQEFERVLLQEGISQFVIFNPNQSMVNDLYKKIFTNSRENRLSFKISKIEIYSRCAILPQEVDSISELISNYSPDTANALKEYTIESDLFNLI